MEWNDWLRYLRERERPCRSQHVTSELMGLGHDSLRKYERGEREPGRIALIKISEYYGITLEELCLGHKKQ